MSRQTENKNVEVITLDSDQEDNGKTDTAKAEICKFNAKQTSFITPTPPPPALKTSSSTRINSTTETSLPILKGLTGFISDFRTLTLDIQRLKASEKKLKETLESKQIELNKASEEWCTAQAQLAKNEMLIEAQKAEMMTLEEQISSVQSRNSTWDLKLNQVSCGLETMFQRASNLTQQDDRIAVCRVDVDGVEILPVEDNNTATTTDATNASSSSMLQVQPYRKSFAFLGRQQMFSKISKQTQKGNPLLSSKWQRGIYKRNSLNVGTRLKFLREKFSKRMTEKQQFQKDIKSELERKSRLLRNLTRFVHKNRLPKVVNNSRLNKEPQLELTIKNVKSLAPKPSSSFSANLNSSTEHERDHSVSVRNGYACTCGDRFKFIAGLHRHIGGNRKFTCDICNMEFLYVSCLTKHLRDNHKRFFSTNTHGCRTCGAVFSSRNELMKGWRHRNGQCMKRKKNNNTG